MVNKAQSLLANPTLLVAEIKPAESELAESERC